MPENPYESPRPETLGIGAPLTPDMARTQLLIPFIFLLVLASLTLALQTFSFVVNLQLAKQQDMNLSQIFTLNSGVFAIFLMNLGVLSGAISALRLSSWRSARVAAILACVPFCSPCFLIGIPFGIWALRVLNNPDVKAAFQK